MSYALVDANGYVGPLATITGYGDLIEELKDAAGDESDEEEKLVMQFVKTGRTTDPQGLASVVGDIHDRMMREISKHKSATLKNLYHLLLKCKEVAIVTES